MTAPASELTLPASVREALDDFVAAAQRAFGDHLRSIVLYGSAAEGRLRATSDVNVLVVLDAFDPARAEALGEPLRLAQAAVGLRVMFLLEREIPEAAAAFAQKFDDIARRRHVLFGPDLFAALHVSRDALRQRVLQTTLNLALRLRAGLVARSRHDEQLAGLVADAAGPLRVAAASVLELEGRAVASPKEALEAIAADEQESAETLRSVSQLREGQRVLEPGKAADVLIHLIRLAQALHARAERVR
jgi:predicted nucleotidyltransferase